VVQNAHSEAFPRVGRLIGQSRGTEGKGQNEIGGSALRVHCGPVDGLEDGARPGLGGRYILMAPTAHNLTRSQIEAVAAYVSYLQ
jgi:hypothetical protein